MLKFAATELAQATTWAQRTLETVPIELHATPGSLEVTSLALLRAAVADDPHRWLSVAVSEPPRLSAEGGELLDTGWTIVAAEAALLAQHLPYAGAVPDIHDLAVAAILLPNSIAQYAVKSGSSQGMAAAIQAAGLSMAAARKALSRAAGTSAGALIMARVELDHDHRPLSAMPFGDWRERPNPVRSQPAATPTSAFGPASVLVTGVGMMPPQGNLRSGAASGLAAKPRDRSSRASTQLKHSASRPSARDAGPWHSFRAEVACSWGPGNRLRACSGGFSVRFPLRWRWSHAPLPGARESARPWARVLSSASWRSVLSVGSGSAWPSPRHWRSCHL